ncbi:MAG: hypothetical protein M3P14_06585 [Chloroflexota bacterium]|nr:hypothetical protein [Chloroflexota bacterium]
MRRAFAFAAGTVTLLALFGGAFAASMPATSRALGAGTAVVAACDANGFTFKPALDATSHVTTVAISGIAAACAGGTLRMTLTNGTTSVGSGSASLPSSGFSGSVTVTISPTPLSTSVTATYAVVEGP